MNLDFSSWRAFAIGSVFTISNGRGITSSEIEENPGTLNAVQSGEDNNGVIGKISVDYCRENDYVFTEHPCLTVARTGSAGFVSFQANGCVVGDSAKILQLRYENASSAVYLFLQSILNKNRFKFSYGRKVTEAKYARDLIDLPVEVDESGSPVIDPTSTYSSEGYVPDWQFMEDFIEGLNHKPLTTSNARPALKLDQATWAKFKVDDFFEIRPTKTYKGLSADDLDDGGQTPFVVNSSVNNGIGGLSTLPPTEDGNKITFSDTTDGNTFFYQPEPFIGFSHVQGMYAKDRHIWTQEELLFLTTILTFDSVGRYNYGRKMTRETIQSREVLLPIAPDGEPDWQFMEDYMRSLPYGDRIPKEPEVI